jgi:hypothetical protein
LICTRASIRQHQLHFIAVSTAAGEAPSPLVMTIAAAWGANTGQRR